MAALDFPLVPNTDSEVTTGDITWKWNGYAWYAQVKRVMYSYRK